MASGFLGFILIAVPYCKESGRPMRKFLTSGREKKEDINIKLGPENKDNSQTVTVRFIMLSRYFTPYQGKENIKD